MTRHLLRIACVLSLGMLCAQATPHRGIWFWNTTTVDGSTSLHSSSLVVGPTSGAAEDEAIAFMTAHGIKEVYGSYKHRPRDVPGEIWPWNAKLDAAGIESQLLISGFEAADPAPLTDPVHASLITKVTDRLIDFNDDAPSTAAQFDALHLDLEPQKLNDWSTGTAADKRVFLDHLLDAYVDIRAALDGAGYASLPMFADIPYTWDKIPGSIEWADAADRDAWFAAVGAVLDGVSIMTFSKDTLTELADATVYERTGPLSSGAGVHVAIQPKVGPGKIWPTYPIFNAIQVGLETAYGEVHLENYAFLRHAYADFGPTIGAYPGLDALPELISSSGGTGGVIQVHGAPGYLYTVRSGSTPGTITRDAATLRTASDQGKEMLTLEVSYGDDPRGFWKVIESEAALPVAP